MILLSWEFIYRERSLTPFPSQGLNMKSQVSFLFLALRFTSQRALRTSPTVVVQESEGRKTATQLAFMLRGILQSVFRENHMTPLNGILTLYAHLFWDFCKLFL